LNHIGAPGDANVASTGALAGKGERLFWPVIDEMEGRPAGAHPRFALLIGEHVDRRMKGGLFRPRALALVEHALPHDGRTDALGGAPNEVIDRPGLPPGPSLRLSRIYC